jgi:hypothetical protein
MIVIKNYFCLIIVFAVVFINNTVQAQKIEGAGISPSKVQAYSGESAQYTVSGLDGHLSWDVTYGNALPAFGSSTVNITWGITPEGKIVVRNNNGKSIETTVQVAPPRPEFRGKGTLFGIQFDDCLIFSDVKDCSYYQWTIPSGCTTEGGISGTFRAKKELYLQQKNMVLMQITSSPKQLYYEGDIKVQAISDKNSLLSRTTTYKYKKLDIAYLKLIEFPDSVDYSDQKTYTIAAENIAGATYKWSINNGTIISGQNTNKIVVKPNYPLWFFNYKLEFAYNGITDSKIISTPVRMKLYIDGPTNMSHGIVEYTLKSPYVNISDGKVFFWSFDYNKYNTYTVNRYIINTDTISTGIHTILGGAFGHFVKLNINKKSSNIYTISNYSNSLVISKNEIKDTLINNSSLIQIFNQQGLLILKKEMPSQLNRLEINLDGIKSGIYFVNIIDGNDITKKKIIIK